MQNQIREFENLTELLDDLEKEGITGISRKRAIDRFFLEKSRLIRAPYAGSFELTPLCNLNCKMCYVHLSKNQMKKEHDLLSVEQWIEIAKQAVDAGMVKADLTGGECLTYPGFQDIYLYLQSRGVQVAILTNGILLTEETVRFLEQHRPVLVQITVYGSNNDAYQKVTGHREFDAVMDGIERLKNAGINVWLTVTPNSYMEDDIEPLLQHLRSLGIGYGIGSVNLPARSNTGRCLDEFGASTDVFIKLQKNEYEYRRNLRSADIRTDNYDYRFKVKGPCAEGIPCSAGKSAFHVNWKGEMTPCIAFSEVTVPLMELGFDKSWEQIGKIMRGYRQPSECRDCDKKDSCLTCSAEKAFGKLDGSVNRSVCDRLSKYIEAGLLRLQRMPDC